MGAAPTIDWQDVAQRVMDPLQLRILKLMISSPESLPAKDIAIALEAPLANVSYHCRRLRGLGLLKIVKEVPVRGSVAKYYVYSGSLSTPS